MSYTEHTWVTGELVTATKLNNMEGGIKNNETLISGMGGSIAPTFSASTAYSKGDYVFYEGLLYRFTANHAAGAWTGTDVTSTDIGADLTDVTDACADLNNALNRYNLLNKFDGVLYSGYWKADGTLTPSAQDACCEHPIPCSANSRVYIKANTTFTNPTYYIAFRDSNNERIGANKTGQGTEFTGIAPTGTNYVTFLFENQA